MSSHKEYSHSRINKWFLYKEYIQKDLENPMKFPTSKRDSKNYNVKPQVSQKLKLSLFAQRVFNLHMKR